MTKTAKCKCGSMMTPGRTRFDQERLTRKYRFNCKACGLQARITFAIQSDGTEKELRRTLLRLIPNKPPVQETW